jgi:hypothetical protein
MFTKEGAQLAEKYFNEDDIPDDEADDVEQNNGKCYSFS